MAGVVVPGDQPAPVVVVVQSTEPSTSAWMWAAGGSLISATALGLMYSKSYSPISEMFMTFPYDAITTADQLRRDPLLPSTVYHQGPWDLVTIISFTLIMLVWINGLSYGLQYLLDSQMQGRLIEVEVEQMVHLGLQIVINLITICSIFICLFKEPFNMSLVWSGFPGYVPFQAKVNMICLIAYGLQCVIYNVFVRNPVVDAMPTYREIAYSTLTCIIAYSSMLIPFAYIMLLGNCILNISGNLYRMIAVANDDGNTTFALLFRAIYVYGSVACHFAYLVMAIVLCCYGNGSSILTKTVVTAGVTLALIVEIMTLLLVLKRDIEAAPKGRKKAASKKK